MLKYKTKENIFSIHTLNQKEGDYMQEVYERVFVASDSFCTRGNETLVVVHACKSPCHQNAIGYRGSLSSEHPNYLALENNNNLYLNIIDPPVPLFKSETFSHFLKFTCKHWNEGKRILVHCNKGESRAPSLALLFLAKGLAVLDNSSYQNARIQFEKIYPRYSPGKGINTYFTENWDKLGNS